MPYPLPAPAVITGPKLIKATPDNCGVTNFRIEATVTAAASASLGLGIAPANSYIYAYSIECQATGAIVTGTEINIGHSGALEAILAGNTFTAIDAVGDTIDPVELASPVLYRAATPLLLSSTDTDGATAGTITSGTWTVVLWGREYSTIGAL